MTVYSNGSRGNSSENNNKDLLVVSLTEGTGHGGISEASSRTQRDWLPY